jgi:hypothetical protein
VLPSSALAAVNFEKDLWPILQKKCVDCHRAPYEENGKAKEPKAGLRLDAAWAILKGSENGPVLKPKNAATSAIYEVVTLPKDDDDFMPPKGDPLTEAEIKLLKQWIDEGAEFGGWVGSTAGAPAGTVAEAPKVMKKREHEEIYKALEAQVKPVPDAVLKQAKAAGAQVAPISTTSPLLRVDFLTGVSTCTDEKVAALLPLAENIAHLDLGRTAISDAALATIAKFPRLTRLDLRQTKVTDKGVEALSTLKHLHSINLFATAVTDAGLKALTSIKSVKNIYAWQTKITPAAASGIKHINIVVK